MRAFVTGATGFIGTRLVEHLLRGGHKVSALVRREARRLPPQVTIVRGRLEDGSGTLRSAMQGHDVVFHLAARISFDPRRVAELLRINAEGTRELLVAARAAPVARTIVVSSACTIGVSTSPDRTLDEATPFDPRWEEHNPYLKSKRLAEHYAFEAARTGQWVTIVNPTTVFGPGDRSLNSGTLVRQVVRSPLVPVPPGGSNVVDVDDVVAGICAAAESGRPGRRYILGGRNLRFREIVERIAEVVGRRPPMIRLGRTMRFPLCAAAWFCQRITRSDLLTPRIIGDTFAFKFYSSRRAESELGWRAKRDLTASLSAAWDYYRREGLIALPSGAAA